MQNQDPEPVLDAKVLETLRLLGGDAEPELFAELVELFVADAQTLLVSLRRALQSHDIKLLERTAHTLKSSCANVGALNMSKACFELEQLGRASRIEGAGPLVERVCSQFEQVRVALAAELSH